MTTAELTVHVAAPAFHHINVQDNTGMIRTTTDRVNSAAITELQPRQFSTHVVLGSTNNGLASLKSIMT